MKLKAIGHRVVHDMQHTNPELVIPELIKELILLSIPPCQWQRNYWHSTQSSVNA